MAPTFFVERLPFETAESCLRSLVKQDGVVSVSFRDAPTGTVAMLEMRTVEAAERAMALLGQVKLGEGPLIVASAEMPRAEPLVRLFAESKGDGQRACGTRRAYTACVLLVDDEPISLHAVQRLLSMHLPDVCVHFAGSGEAALLLNRTREFDAVVSDVQMPGLDGFAFVVENARIKPDTPVVLMTGNPL